MTTDQKAKEPRRTMEETAGCVAAERALTLPKSMTARADDEPYKQLSSPPIHAT